MFEFKKTKMMNITLVEDQYKQISSKEKIYRVLASNEAIGFDIIFNDKIIGFAMLREYDEGCYFLWNYAIDYKYQNKQYGTKALKNLIEYFKANYSLKEIELGVFFFFF